MKLHFASLALLLATGCGEGQKAKESPFYGSPGQHKGCSLTPNESLVRTFDTNTTNTFNSGDSSEMISCLPSLFPHAVLPLPVFRVKLQNIKANDAVVIFADMEVTNDFPIDFMFVTFITVGKFEVAEAQGYNVTPGMHHGSTTRNAVYVSPNDQDEIEITLWAYGADGALFTPTYVIVEPDYGRLSGVVIRK
jgi:hypothetical protein